MISPRPSSIYCDNAATTQIHPDVLSAMERSFAEFGNPSSLHPYGSKANLMLEKAREQCAKSIGCQPCEIVFTSGATEANNMAILGRSLCKNATGSRENNHFISVPTEHSAVYAPLKYLEELGYPVTWLNVDGEGFIDIEELRSSIRPETILVSIMFANNEIGTIQNIAAIGEICRSAGVVFHTDAVQAIGKVAIDVNSQNIDMLAMSAHKIHGPKGIGFLYKRGAVELKPLLHGGTQEEGLKPGTENVSGAVGLGRALEIATAEMSEESARLEGFARELLSELNGFERMYLNGPKDFARRIPGNLNVCFEGLDADQIVLNMGLAGVAISSGSACSEGKIDPSRVIVAIRPHSPSHGLSSIRISFGKFNCPNDVQDVAALLIGIVSKQYKKIDAQSVKSLN